MDMRRRWPRALHPVAGMKTESKGQGHMGLRARFWEAPGEGLGISKAKKGERAWINERSMVGYPHHQSYSQLCSAASCLMAAMLHAPREAEAGPAALYHPTATMEVAQGHTHPPASLLLMRCCLHRDVSLFLGSGCMENSGKNIQLPMHKSMQYISTKSAYGISYS